VLPTSAWQVVFVLISAMNEIPGMFSFIQVQATPHQRGLLIYTHDETICKVVFP